MPNDFIVFFFFFPVSRGTPAGQVLRAKQAAQARAKDMAREAARLQELWEVRGREKKKKKERAASSWT